MIAQKTIGFGLGSNDRNKNLYQAFYASSFFAKEIAIIAITD
jgi:hypothetical protein